MAKKTTAQDGDPVALDDGQTRVPCIDPSCIETATNRCYDGNVDQEVAFCDAHIDEWLEKDHIVKID